MCLRPPWAIFLMVCLFFNALAQASDRGTNIDMQPNTSSSKYMTVDALMKAARNFIGGKLPTETYQSLPIPMHIQGKIVAGFLLGPSVLRPMEGMWLIAPTHRLYLDVTTGEGLLLQSIQPSDFGVSVNAGHTLGKHDMLAGGRTPEEYLASQKRLYLAYDLLWEPFNRKSSKVNAETRSAASEFKETFSLVGEAPLMPFYSAFGRDFFDWLDQVTK